MITGSRLVLSNRVVYLCIFSLFVFFFFSSVFRTVSVIFTSNDSDHKYIERPKRNEKKGRLTQTETWKSLLYFYYYQQRTFFCRCSVPCGRFLSSSGHCDRWFRGNEEFVFSPPPSDRAHFWMFPMAMIVDDECWCNSRLLFCSVSITCITLLPLQCSPE